MKLPALFFLPFDSGLGNQLFIAAAAKAYRDRTQRDVYLIVDRVSSQMRHGWFEEVIELKGIKMWRGLQATIFSRIVNFFCREPRLGGPIFQWSDRGGFTEEERFLSSRAFIFRGYFQSSCFPNPVYRLDGPDSAKLPKNIDPAIDVAVHVRRGDYLTPENQNLYGSVRLADLLSHGQEIAGHTGGRLVIFSDSPNLVKEELSKFASPAGRSSIVFISDLIDSLSPAEELRLMALFLHLVISNSTFSLWAARLGPPKKQVIAPWPWFKGDSQPTNIIPIDWHTANLVQ